MPPPQQLRARNLTSAINLLTASCPPSAIGSGTATCQATGITNLSPALSWSCAARAMVGFFLTRRFSMARPEVSQSLDRAGMASPPWFGGGSDEVHNLLGYDNKAVNLFLKTFVQDGGGFCLIVIGTPVLRKFIFEQVENVELAGRLLDMPLEQFPEATSLGLISGALEGLCSDAGLRLAPSIHRDPYFAHRILEGCRGSYGRSMRLISTSIVLALEEGASAVDIEDFRRVFDLNLLYFNPENPFRLSDWASRSTAGFGQPGQVSDTDFGAATKKPQSRTRRKRSKK